MAPYPIFPKDEILSARQETLQFWKRVDANQSEAPGSAFEVDDSADGEAASFFDYLATREIPTLLMVLPAARLEPSENEAVNYSAFVRRLEEIQARYPNILGVWDINQRFRHPLRDPQLFFDATEHASEEGAKKIADLVARRLAVESFHSK